MIPMGILVGTTIFVGLYSMYVVFKCRHSWEFVDKTEFPPPIEVAVKNGVNLTWGLTTWQRHEMSKKTVLIVLRCPKCGKSQILRETH